MVRVPSPPPLGYMLLARSHVLEHGLRQRQQRLCAPLLALLASYGASHNIRLCGAECFSQSLLTCGGGVPSLQVPLQVSLVELG